MYSEIGRNYDEDWGLLEKIEVCTSPEDPLKKLDPGLYRIRFAVFEQADIMFTVNVLSNAGDVTLYREMIRTAMRHYEYIESEDSYEMAVEWARFRNYERAEACLRRAIELNPRFTYAYMDLALVYARQKKFGQAAAAVRKAIKADPSFHRLYYLVAKYAFRAGDFPLAVKYIDRAIELSPEPLYVKARTIIHRGRERR